MSMIRKVTPAQVSDLGDDVVEATLSTSDLARDGHVLDAGGAKLDNFRKNPVILWQHQPEEPVARADDVRVTGDKIVARIRFAPSGVSPTADRIRGLVKSGIINTMSVGFEPLDGEPLDPKKPRGGQRFSSWELLEASFCSVPIDPGSVITARAHSGLGMDVEVLRRRWRMLAAQGRPLSFDERVAEVRAARAGRGRSARLAAAQALAVEPPLSRAERLAEVAALAPRPPVYSGHPARWSAEMREHLERQVLAGSAARRDDFGARQQAARDLARCP